jgi:hypothetical protein
MQTHYCIDPKFDHCDVAVFRGIRHTLISMLLVVPAFAQNESLKGIGNDQRDKTNPENKN